MNDILKKYTSGANLYKVIAVIAICIVFGKQIGKLLSFFRGRFTGAVVGNSVSKKVAADSGVSASTISTKVRQETCKSVASSVYAYLHQKPLGWLPISIFGSIEDEAAAVAKINTLNNGLEAKYMSQYYFEKYGDRLNNQLIKYLDNEYKNITPALANNIL